MQLGVILGFRFWGLGVPVIGAIVFGGQYLGLRISGNYHVVRHKYTRSPGLLSWRLVKVPLSTR